MSVATFYEHLDLPEDTALDRRIYKNLVLEHGQHTAADKRCLSDDVIHLTWKYTLKPSTVQILPFQDGEREYLEVAVVEAALRNRRRGARIAEMIQRVIPYPVVLVLVEGTGFCVSVAHKRFSLAEKGVIVAEDFLRTPWTDEPKAVDLAFFSALMFGKLSQIDFYAFYTSIMKAVLARNCAELTGCFELKTGTTEADRRQLLVECHALEREIAGLREEIRREAPFAEKVDLNTRIKELEACLEERKSRL